VTADYYINKKW